MFCIVRTNLLMIKYEILLDLRSWILGDTQELSVCYDKKTKQKNWHSLERSVFYKTSKGQFSSVTVVTDLLKI